MTKKSIMNAVSFRYALLDSYKRMNIMENELVVLLMIDHLLEQGNSLITNDMLSLKMNYSSSEIDKILVGLLKRGFVSMEMKDNKMRTSIDPLKEKVYAQFKKMMELENASLATEEKENVLQELCEFFESRFQRTLSPLEREMIGNWVNAGYKKQEIEDALLDAFHDGKRTVKAIDRVLRSKRMTQDFEKEGYSASSSSWDKDIEETMAIAKAMWGSDDGKK